MIDVILNLFSAVPHELATFLLAMMPIGELRLALPIGVLVYHLPVWKVFVISIIGNFVPAVIILFFADRFHRWVEKKSGFFSTKWINNLARAQKKFSGNYEKYGLIGLLLFVGIPLPGTGAYTGALAAVVFGIPMKKSWLYVFSGVIMSALIVTILTVGVDKVF